MTKYRIISGLEGDGVTYWFRPQVKGWFFWSDLINWRLRSTCTNTFESAKEWIENHERINNLDNKIKVIWKNYE